MFVDYCFKHCCNQNRNQLQNVRLIKIGEEFFGQDRKDLADENK